MTDPLPVLVMAGGNDRVETIPEGVAPDDVLKGFKGAVRLPSGRCIAGELIQRMRDSRRFEDPVLVGPRHVYGDLVDCEISDTPGDLLANIRRFAALLTERYPERPVAVSACDILPTAEEFRSLLDEGYAPSAGSGLWWQMIAAEPREMGVSSWKPSYRMRPAPREPLLNLYPGHLLVLRPNAVRLDWFNMFLMMAYRYRNRSVYERVIRITLRAVGLWLEEDGRLLRNFRCPGRTVAAPYGILKTYLRYTARRLTVPELAAELSRQIMVRDDAGDMPHPVAMTVTRIRSFAKDIDTRGELEEIAG